MNDYQEKLNKILQEFGSRVWEASMAHTGWSQLEVVTAINALNAEAIGPDNAYVACDQLHLDAYKVQPWVKAELRKRFGITEDDKS